MTDVPEQPLGQDAALRVDVQASREAPPPAESRKSPLALRYQQTQAAVADIRQSLILRTSTRSDMYEGNAGQPVTLLQVKSESVALMKQAQLPRQEFLSQSARFLATANHLEPQLAAQSSQVSAALEQAENENRTIQGQLDAIAGKGWGGRVLSLPERSRLQRRQQALQVQLGQLRAQQEQIESQKAELEEARRPVRERQSGLIGEEVREGMEAMKKAYGSFVGELLGNHDFVVEIKEGFITEHILPVLERTDIDPPIDQGKKAELLTMLRASFNSEAMPKQERLELRQKIMRFVYGERGFDTLGNKVNELIEEGMVEDQIGRFVSHVAAQDLAREASLLTDAFGSDSAVKKAIDSAKSDFSSLYQDGGRSIRLRSLHPQEDGLNHDKFNLAWIGMRRAGSIMDAFPEQASQVDSEFRTYYLQQSLTDRDGKYIDSLQYYPVPETVRNLTLIAAADLTNYRTAHANGTLARLAQRPDWQELLDKTQEQYPEVAAAREILSTWSLKTDESQPGLREVAMELARATQAGSGSNRELARLSMEVMDNQSLAQILIEKGLVSAEDGRALIETIDSVNETYAKDSAINPYYLNDNVRGSALGALTYPADSKEGKIFRAYIERYTRLSKEMKAHAADKRALSYLASSAVVNALGETKLSEEQVSLLIGAASTHHAIAEGIDLEVVMKHPDLYISNEGLHIIAAIRAAYSEGNTISMNKILRLVGEGKLTFERALELPVKAAGIVGGELFATGSSAAEKYADLFLQTDEGVLFYTKLMQGGLLSLRESDMVMGRKLIAARAGDEFSIGVFTNDIMTEEFRRVDAAFAGKGELEINDSNWLPLALAFVRQHANVYGMPPPQDKALQARIEALFNRSQAKDLVLRKIQESWTAYLHSGDLSSRTFTMQLIPAFISYCQGAGPLTQVEALGMYIGAYENVQSRPTTTAETRSQLYEGTRMMDDRFSRERWSNEDKTDYFNISRSIMLADPTLFSDYLDLFSGLSPAQMKSFGREVYPLYRARLALIEQPSAESGQRQYKPGELERIREEIRAFAVSVKGGQPSMEDQRSRVLTEIQAVFKERFGILKISESFTAEHTRSVTDMAMYLSNMNDRTPQREAVMSYYLALMVNDKWDKFRAGESFPPEEYLSAEKATVVSPILEQRKQLNPVTAENLGIPPEQLSQFRQMLQVETQNVVVGDVETIDVKLGNVIANLRTLEDLDLYTNPLDKGRMQLLLQYGNKRIGSVAARMYQQLSSPGRAVQFSPEDLEVRQAIEDFCREQGLELTPETIKTHMQEGLKPLATVTNLLQFTEGTHAEAEISKLRGLLAPSEEVIAVFTRLGEDFKPSSGAMALTQDLSYLDNLIVKRESELQPGEKEALLHYTSQIRAQVVMLQGLYEQIKNKFVGMRQGNQQTTNTLLAEKFIQIERIINAQSLQQSITSTATCNMNTIIENMRECLACTRQGGNNDTNLSFGDGNKFYLYTQLEGQGTGSISDEVLFFEPARRADGTMEMSFVLDKIYETNTPAVLTNQLSAAIKKYRMLRQNFPSARMSILVTPSALQTGGLSADLLIKWLESSGYGMGKAAEETLEVDIVPTATGDHYVEFAGKQGRISGKNQVTGVVLRM